MENYRLNFENGQYMYITVEDYSEALWEAEDYEYENNTKLRDIWEV